MCKNLIDILVSGIPTAEKFSFCLHTLLSDIAVRCEDYRNEIIDTQVGCMVTLTNNIIKMRDPNNCNSSSKLFLCKTTLPVLIGLSRAMGRFCFNDPPLICRIFPKPEPPLGRTTTDKTPSYNRSFSSFRSIIPSSLSGNLTATFDILAITQVIEKNISSTYILDTNTYILFSGI